MVGGRERWRGAGSDLEGAIPVEAFLVPEPRNPYWRGHAVRVDVNGSKVGYLPSDEAARYRPVLDKLWRRQGALGTCRGSSWVAGIGTTACG